MLSRWLAGWLARDSKLLLLNLQKLEPLIRLISFHSIRFDLLDQHFGYNLLLDADQVERNRQTDRQRNRNRNGEPTRTGSRRQKLNFHRLAISKCSSAEAEIPKIRSTKIILMAIGCWLVRPVLLVRPLDASSFGLVSKIPAFEICSPILGSAKRRSLNHAEIHTHTPTSKLSGLQATREPFKD